MAFVTQRFSKGIELENDQDRTKKVSITVSNSATTATTTTIQAAQTANRTISLPDATTTLVGTDVTQTLTNKTIVAASNTITTASSGNLVATELNAALAELQTDIDTRATTTQLNDHINDATAAHAASAVSNTPSGNLAATDVQAALNELQTDIDTRATSTALTDHINDATAAHAASAIANTPSGNLAATDVQTALNELQTDVDTRATSSALTTHTGASTGVHGVTGSVVGTSDTQTLSNKSLEDSTTLFIDNLDNTKKMQFQLSGITTATTRTLTIPDANTTLVGTDTTQTLTNKTLTSPVISTISNTGTLTLPTSTDTLVGRATTDTLTNKTLTSPAINGANISMGTASNSNRIVLPTETTTNLDALTDTQGLIAYDTSLNKPVYNDGSQWTAIGSGSGTGINYITNGDFEANTTGWSTFDDGPVTAPVDGTSGIPSYITISRQTTTPLRGNGELYIINAGGGSAQGEGVSDDFTIDRSSRYSVLQIQFDYEIISGTYDPSDGTVTDLSDLVCYIVADPGGTPVVIQPTPYKLVGAVVGQNYKFRGEFQTTDATTYRLVLMCPTTNTAAWTVAIDNVVVGPSNVSAGTTEYYIGTETWTDSQTNATTSVQVYRRGAHVRLYGETTFTGAASGSNHDVTIPSQYRPSSTIYTNIGTSNKFYKVGTAMLTDVSASALYGASAYLTSTTNLRVYWYDASNATGIEESVNTTLPFTPFASGDLITFQVEWAVEGWASSSVASQDTDQRVVAASYKISASTANSSVADNAVEILDYDTKIFDTHGAVTTGASWKFTAPVPGIYEVSAHLLWGNVTNLNSAQLMVYKNAAQYAFLGTATSAANHMHGGTALVSMIAGDYIDIRALQDDSTGAARSISTTADRYLVNIKRLSGPEQMLASEGVMVYASSSGTQSLTNNTYRFIDFNSVAIDTHGAVVGAGGGISSTASSAWRFVAPIAGIYLIQAQILVASGGGWAAGEDLLIRFYINGGAGNYTQYTVHAAHTTNIGGNSQSIFRLKAGDYIQMAAFQNSGGDINVGAGFIQIARIGI